MYVYTSRSSYRICQNIRIIPILKFFIINNQHISAFINYHETRYFSLVILSMKLIKCTLLTPTPFLLENLMRFFVFLVRQK